MVLQVENFAASDRTNLPLHLVTAKDLSQCFIVIIGNTTNNNENWTPLFLSSSTFNRSVWVKTLGGGGGFLICSLFFFTRLFLVPQDNNNKEQDLDLTLEQKDWFRIKQQ